VFGRHHTDHIQVLNNATPLKYIVTLYLYNRKKNNKFNKRAKRVAKKNNYRKIRRDFGDVM